VFWVPWGSKTVEKLREEFVLTAKASNNISSVCREYGITRKTGYKWLGRAETNSFGDLSRRPKTIRNKTDPNVEKRILQVRQSNPAWGGKTIRKVLENEGRTDLPCVKTCNNILKRNDCIDAAEGLKHKPCQRFEREKCNELWQTDFKGEFALLDGSRCFPLTILDDHSRFSIGIDPKPNTLGVKDSFKKAFSEYGQPDAVLSDNGPQFSGFRGGYTQFERWLMDLDILPIHGRIMHPQTQGKIERFHRTMKQELLKHIKFCDLEDANIHLQGWKNKYNYERPHEALGMKCPGEVYVPSGREYKDTVRKYEYSGANHIIKVNNWGYLRFDKWQLYLSETMSDTYLEIRPNPLGDSFIVCYRNFKIAEVNAFDGKLLNRNIHRL
jgi:transposase InsO family protein